LNNIEAISANFRRRPHISKNAHAGNLRHNLGNNSALDIAPDGKFLMHPLPFGDIHGNAFDIFRNVVEEMSKDADFINTLGKDFFVRPAREEGFHFLKNLGKRAMNEDREKRPREDEKENEGRDAQPRKNILGQKGSAEIIDAPEHHEADGEHGYAFSNNAFLNEFHDSVVLSDLLHMIYGGTQS
jgi:hypothetical protein